MLRLPGLQRLLGGALFISLIVAAPSLSADWTNSGGNAGRNGLTTEIGPTSAQVAWSGARNSLIAWLPVTEGDRVFTVRQAKWPYQQPNDAYVVAHNLVTGQELWAVVLPYNSGDWTPWIAGVRDGKVYCSRSGNGASISARMYALDVVDGSTVWVSDDLQDAGPYDGTVFAPDGDLIVGSFQDIWRFDAQDGSTVWHANRVGSVSSSCGGAIYGDAFYVADAVGGGHAIVRYDLATGARMYQSPTMPGFTLQNTPMVGPDGAIYLCRVQNNPSVDFFYAFTDTGAEFVEKWNIPSFWCTTAEFGIGPDGSIYMLVPGPRLARLKPDDGTIVNQTAVLSGATSAHIAIDADGKVFYSNSSFATGRLYSFDADLTPRWDVAVTNINIGGPAIGRYGTLIVCGVGTDMRAYRTQNPADIAELAGLPSGAPTLQVGPNPFGDAATLRYRLGKDGSGRLAVYDAAGRLVRTLVSGQLTAGDHAVVWEGKDDAGARLPSGVYYYRLDAPDGKTSGRMLMTR